MFLPVDRLCQGLAPFSALVLLFACGVQEHEQPAETKERTRPVIMPPAPTSSGGTPSSGGSVAAAGNPGAGGAPPTAGGSPGFGGFRPAGGAGGGGAVPSSGGGGASGGSVAAGGSPIGGSATGGNATTGGSATTGGRSGIMVDINGTMLPKEDVIAFIHLGHSNMAGRTSSPSSERPYHFEELDLHAWMFKDNLWDPAIEPTAGDEDNTSFGRVLGGPGTALVKQAVAMAPSKYFVSLGWGRGSAYCSQFLPGGLYYDQLMKAPLGLKGKVTFGAIVIMLGITERHGTSNDISGFPNCINTLVTAIRTDLAEPNIPLLLCDYEMESTGPELSPDGEFAQSIIPQIRNVPNVVSRSAIVPTEDIEMMDDHHFDLVGNRQWSGRVLSVMKEKGWFPWTN
jgi:hypothetical protein